MPRRRADSKPGRPSKRARTQADGPVSLPLRKYAIVFGYIGDGYYGMQRQMSADAEEACRTIEGELEKALVKAEALAPEHLLNMGRLQWARVGRTDKGVHAACQVVTVRMTLGPITPEEASIFQRAYGSPADPEEVETVAPDGSADCQIASLSLLDEETIAERKLWLQEARDLQRRREIAMVAKLQEALPEHFRVFEIFKVIPQFDARMRAVRRRYEYILPSWLLRRFDLKDNYDDLQQFYSTYCPDILASEHSLPLADKKRVLKALESASEDPNELLDTSSPEAIGSLINRWYDEVATFRKAYASLSAEDRAKVWKDSGETFEKESEDFVPPFGPQRYSAYSFPPNLSEEDLINFRLSDEDFGEFQSLLQNYCGTHHWYNFTSRINPEDATGRRLLDSIEAERHIRGGRELIVVRLLGESFLLNQIRKMISLGIEAWCGRVSPRNSIQWLLTSGLVPKKHVHLAPGEGLLLERAFFDSWNVERTRQYTRVRMEDSEQIDEFKKSVIYPWMSKASAFQRIWRRYLADLMWHPFALENYPKPRGEPQRRAAAGDRDSLDGSGGLTKANEALEPVEGGGLTTAESADTQP